LHLRNANYRTVLGVADALVKVRQITDGDTMGAKAAGVFTADPGCEI
jgi:hypothetical protein